jgi:hypothetical protein
VGKAFFKPALRAAGLPEALRLYDLRHTCASLPIAQGASVKAVQVQLGHATASITLDTYGHLFPSELEALADRLEQTRMAALANRERTQRGPAVVRLGESAGPPTRRRWCLGSGHSAQVSRDIVRTSMRRWARCHWRGWW